MDSMMPPVVTLKEAQEYWENAERIVTTWASTLYFEKTKELVEPLVKHKENVYLGYARAAKTVVVFYR